MSERQAKRQRRIQQQPVTFTQRLLTNPYVLVSLDIVWGFTAVGIVLTLSLLTWWSDPIFCQVAGWSCVLLSYIPFKYVRNQRVSFATRRVWLKVTIGLMVGAAIGGAFGVYRCF